MKPYESDWVRQIQRSESYGFLKGFCAASGLLILIYAAVSYFGLSAH